MRTLRRALIAVGAAAVAAAIVRLRGNGGTPPRRGGWRELSDDELAAGDVDAPFAASVPEHAAGAERAPSGLGRG